MGGVAYKMVCKEVMCPYGHFLLLHPFYGGFFFLITYEITLSGIIVFISVV